MIHLGDAPDVKFGAQLGSGMSLENGDYSKYAFSTNQYFRDLVSNQLMDSVNEAGRFNYSGTEFGADVPVLEGGKLITGGAYTQLVPKSEDTSSTWAGSGPWTQSINLGDTGTYTVSTDLAGVTITITAGTATIDAGASATYGSPDQFVVTGAGTVTISTDTADPKAQLTLSTYKLPYAVNTTAGSLSVPHNYADADEGNKWTLADAPLLLDAIDGIADGSEGFTDLSFNNACGVDWTCGNDWSIANGEATKGGPSTGNLSQLTSYSTGDYVELSFTVSAYTSGTLSILLGGGNLVQLSVTGVGDYIVRGVFSSAVNTSTGLRSDTGDNFLGSISDISIKEISLAQGELQLNWTPKFDAADVSGVVNILTANDETGSFLFYNGATEEIHAHDGTNTAVVACTPVADTTYSIKLIWGDSSGQKMGVVVDSTAGTLATHAGSFDTSTKMSVGWTASAFQEISPIKIYKAPQSW